MKTILIGINAKYIHTNLALRYLYTYTNNSFDVEFVEFTIKNEIDYIITQILSFKPDLIGFSCYIWNIEIISEIITQLKTKTKAKILLGGPEVYDVKHWFNDLPVDFIITGEGEYPFKQLLYALLENKSLNNIPQLHFCDNNKVHTNENTYFIDLNTLPSPYRLEVDLPELKHRIQYIESSRGCPYHCSYCLASLEKNVRYFANIKSEISYLMKNGGKIFKFLDRTFNLRKDFALDMFTFIIDNHLPGCVFQFEITGELLDSEIIDFLNQHAPKGLIRFEIGIQSTNDNTNKLVLRKQNFAKLKANIQKIQKGGKIILHLDLIAGLPKENYQSFKKTFNDVFELRPEELQLGFLKLLRGTKLRKDAEQYHYTFQHHAPYEVIANDVITASELNLIRSAEEILEKYYNSHRFDTTLKYILDNYYPDDNYLFFEQFGEFYLKHYMKLGYQIYDLCERLLAFINVPIVEQLLIYDYLHNAKTRPKIWFQPNVNKAEKHHIFNSLQNYSLDFLFRYTFVHKLAINPLNFHLEACYLIKLFAPDNKKIIIIKDNQ
jgi:radical SAM superfamily enzyme YgiQ (UPF0313 family)